MLVSITGNETATTLGATINAAGAATPNDTDLVATALAAGVLKKISWTNVKAFLKTYFDSIYQAAGSYITSGGALGTPSSGTGTNITGIPAANILAGSLGTGAYTMDTSITVPQTFNADHAITCSSNAATVTRAYRNNVVTNDSANNMTITLSTAGATAGDMLLIQVVDFSGVAKSITWVNTENGEGTAATTSNGSTSLPKSNGFKWNPLTSKWRCLF